MRVLAFLLLATAACAQTTFPAWVFQKKTSASSASVPVVISGQNNKVFGLDGSGNLSLLTNGSGSSTLAGLGDVAITGDYANEDLLRYDTNESKWLNISSETLLGAPVIALRDLADGVGALTNDGAGVLSWVSYQEADATLAALAALDGTTGFLKQTGADTFTRSGIAATDIVVNPFEVAGKALVATGGGSGAAAFGNVSLAYTTGSLDGSSRVIFGTNETDGGGNAGRILKRTHQNGTASVGWGFLHPEDVAASGSALQYLRRNADNTALEWATFTGTTPGGSGSELQYNNGGAFGAVSGSAVAAGGAVTLGSNGAASTPPLLLAGTWYTGGTATSTKPALLIEPAGTTSTGWATTGTGLGVNAPSGFGGLLFDFQVAGSSKFKYTHSGRGTLTVNADSGASHIIYFDSGKLTMSKTIQLNDTLYTVTSNVGDSSGVLRSMDYSETTTHFVVANDGDAVAATVQFGLDHATTATNQLIKAHDVTTGTGASMTIAGGKGSAAGGAVILATSASNGAPSAKVEARASGSVAIGAQSALATNAGDGFLYVPTCAGTPTGVPTSITGLVPIVVDSTNNKLYFYSGGAWRDAGP